MTRIGFCQAKALLLRHIYTPEWDDFVIPANDNNVDLLESIHSLIDLFARD